MIQILLSLYHGIGVHCFQLASSSFGARQNYHLGGSTLPELLPLSRPPSLASTGAISVDRKAGRIHDTRLSVATAASLPLDSNRPTPSSSVPLVDATNPKVGVLLLNLGGPERGEDVEGFLYNLFADPDIIQLPGPLAPLQSLIALFISKRRAPKSRAAYESIGGGSPILKYSNAQAELLCRAVRGRYGLDVTAYVGMRYWHPFTEEALERIRRDQIEALVIVPLYPQFSISTSGSSLRVLQEEFSKYGPKKYRNMVHTVVPSWYQRPGYVRAITDLIQTELDAFSDNQIREAQRAAPQLAPLHVLFSAHGVPQSYIEAGDPYQTQIKDSVAQIERHLLERADAKNRPVEIHLSYQSRVGPIEWLRPYTDDVLPSLGERGVKNLVVVPISFVSEHVETLEEIDIEYRELAEEHGISNWRRCPALNTDPTFIDDLADLVVEALSEPIQTVTEACVANMVANIEQDEQRLGITGVQGVGAEGALFPVSAASGGGGRKQRQKLQERERLNARVAMAGVLLTVLVELVRGQSLVHLFGN